MPSRPLSPDALYDVLQDTFDPATYSRATRIVREGLVRACVVQADKELYNYSIAGLVEGSAPEPYLVTLTVTAHIANGELDVMESLCSCPVREVCKHACALVLHWTSRWPTVRGGPRRQAAYEEIVAGSWIDEGVAMPSLPATKRRAPPPPPPPVVRRTSVDGPLADWLRALPDDDPPRPDAPKKAPPRHIASIAYVLTDDGRLHAMRARRERGSGASELTGEYVSTTYLQHGRDLPAYATPGDVSIVQLIRTVSDGPFTYEPKARLSGEVGTQLLNMAAATGRLHAIAASALTAALGKKAPAAARALPPPLVFGGITAATLAWHAVNAGKIPTFTLGARIAGKDIPLIPTDPPLVLDLAGHRVAPASLPLSGKSLVRVASLPPLPRDDLLSWAFVRDALDALPDASALPPLPLPEAVTIPTPVAVLGFALVEYSYQRGWGRNAHTEDAVIPAAHLWFDYGGRRVPVLAHGFLEAIEVEQAGRDVRTLLVRNVRAENQWIKRLPARLVPAVQVEPSFAVAAMDQRAMAPSLFAVPGHDWAAHGAEVLADAQAAGFELEIDPAFPLSFADVPSAELTLTPSPERGWFRIALGITLDGEPRDIAPALARLIGAQADPEAWLAQLPGMPAVLLSLAPTRPGGPSAVVRLPGERLHGILAPVFDWFRGGKPADISALQAALQPDLPATAIKYLGRDDKRWIALREAVAAGVRLRPVAPASGFLATLRPYQLHGLAWLDHLHALGMAGVLADDMGLGKTVQTLAFLHARKAGGAQLGNTKPSLIIAPTSVTVNWQAEAARFVPGMNVLVHRGAARSLDDAALAGVDLIVTSYPILQRDESRFAELEFDVVVFDEAQTIKNARAKTYQAAQSLNAHMRLALTGTPMENHLGELWALFNLLLPGLLGDLDNFNRVFRHPIEQRAATGQMVKLRARIRPFLLRRTREQVLDDLPEKTEYTRWIELNADQTDLYESLRTAIHDDIRRAIDKKGLAQSTIHILDALLKLRQVCCDPRLVRLPEGDAKSTRFSNAGSAKLDWLMNHIPELLDEGRQVLVFSQFTSMLALIGEALTARGIDYESLTGDTQDRATPVARFQAGEVKVFLLSLKAGGVGLNLTAADTVIHYDPWWNPAVEAQATARAHRMGQEKAVFVTKLVSRGTLEERMLVLLARKRELAGALLEGEGSALTGLTVADVEELLAPVSTFVAQTK